MDGGIATQIAHFKNASRDVVHIIDAKIMIRPKISLIDDATRQIDRGVFKPIVRHLDGT